MPKKKRRAKLFRHPKRIHHHDYACTPRSRVPICSLVRYAARLEASVHLMARGRLQMESSQTTISQVFRTGRHEPIAALILDPLATRPNRIHPKNHDRYREM
jgi:hypothetical protein